MPADPDRPRRAGTPDRPAEYLSALPRSGVAQSRPARPCPGRRPAHGPRPSPTLQGLPYDMPRISRSRSLGRWAAIGGVGALVAMFGSASALAGPTPPGPVDHWGVVPPRSASTGTAATGTTTRTAGTNAA